MTWRAFFRPSTLLFLALWIVLLVGGRSRFFQDPGTFWHIVVGQQILESRGFFDTDEFTFTFAGKTWIPHQWLGECIIALTHAIDGFDTLLLFTATLLAGLFTWLGVRLIRCGLHPSLAVVLVALAVAASSGHFHVRPHLASIVGFAVTMCLLCDFENRRSGSERLAWLIPLCLVWSNIHGGVLGGVATFALAIGGWFFFWKLGWESPVSSYRQMMMLMLILLGCAATVFVNPYGLRLPETWFDIYRMPSLPRLIKEHSPIDLADRNAWMILLFGGVYVAVLAGTLPGKPRIVWLLPIVWFALACLRIRHAPLFAVGALIAIADLFPQTRFARSLQARGSDLFEKPNATSNSMRDRLAAMVLPAFVAIIALSLQIARVQVPVLGHGWAKIDPQIWPLELLDPLRAGQHDRPGGTRIFNEYAYGGFLIYYVPGYRVYVDDRCELFGDAWLSEFLDAPYLDPDSYIENAEKKYGTFDYALVFNDPTRGFDKHFSKSPNWLEVKRTESTVLFRRAAGNPFP